MWPASDAAVPEAHGLHVEAATIYYVRFCRESRAAAVSRATGEQQETTGSARRALGFLAHQVGEGHATTTGLRRRRRRGGRDVARTERTDRTLEEARRGVDAE